MNWARFLLAVVLSGFATTLTDWLFMGVLFHKKYLATPEIWRIKPGQNDTRSIVLSYRATLHTSLLIWVAAAVPIIFSNIVWIKMDPLLGVSHSLGWLARFVVTGMIGNWLLH